MVGALSIIEMSRLRSCMWRMVQSAMIVLALGAVSGDEVRQRFSVRMPWPGCGSRWDLFRNAPQSAPVGMKLYIVKIAQTFVHGFGPMRAGARSIASHTRSNRSHSPGESRPGGVPRPNRVQTVFPVSVGVLLSDYEFGGGNCQALIRFVTVQRVSSREDLGAEQAGIVADIREIRAVTEADPVLRFRTRKIVDHELPASRISCLWESPVS